MPKRKKLIVGNEFYCCKCGSRGLDIVRTRGREKEPGHLKKLWCLNCKEEINHAECVPYGAYDYDNFLEEFLGNNFTEEQTRKQPYGLFKNEKIKKGEWKELEKKVIDYILKGVDEE